MREAIAADGEAHRALLAGEDARLALRRAADAYRVSWEAAPPRSFGRLVGYAKASILAGENPAPYVREQLHGEADSPPSSWALALAALADGDDEAARRAADGMLAGSEAFGRAAGAVAALARRDRQAYAGMVAAIVNDFERREEHLTGVPIADTALVLERLAERGHPRRELAQLGLAVVPAPAAVAVVEAHEGPVGGRHPRLPRTLRVVTDGQGHAVPAQEV